MSGAGRITAGITKQDNLVTATIDFVYAELPKWRDDAQRPAEQSEKKLNLQLCKFLDNRARDEFPMACFQQEEPQTGRAQVDMSASPTETIIIGVNQYSIYDPYLVIEGKRLPAPSANREREYLTGETELTGGIQRFKLGVHGAAFDVSAMVGYLQEQTTEYWHTAINQWIEDMVESGTHDQCVWTVSEKLGNLEQDNSQGTAKCISDHGRIGDAVSNKITIHHLWVEMNPTHS